MHDHIADDSSSWRHPAVLATVGATPSSENKPVAKPGSGEVYRCCTRVVTRRAEDGCSAIVTDQPTVQIQPVSARSVHVAAESMFGTE